MMKNVLMCISVIFLIIAVGAIAQTQEKASSSTSEAETVQAETTPSPAPVNLEASKTPRVYPIAAGVWYPGDPLPKKPFRYYRIRCWPGCHHNSEYGKYEELPENDTPAHTGSENSKKELQIHGK